MAVPTEKELHLVKKFRNQISQLNLTEEQNSEVTLLRWIRACENDLKEAEERLRKTLKWREVNELETILDWESNHSLMDLFPMEIIGSDKESRPVLVIPIGKWNIRRSIENGEKSYIFKHCDRMLASLDALMETNSTETKKISQFVVIYDFEDFDLRQITSVPSVEAILEIIDRFQDNFPETLKNCFCVNVPKVFSILFGIIKPSLSQKTLGKIEIYGSHVSKWKVALLKQISSDIMPPKFGGTNISCVKEFLYGIQIDDQCDEFISVEVQAGKKFEVDFPISEENSFLSWTFRTDGFDIGFSILYEGEEEIVPYQKVDSHLGQLNGSHICEKSGTISLVFDNSYSVLRSKKLHYLISIATPSEVISLDD